MSIEDTYASRDLAESALLLVKNQKLLRLQREGRVVYFIFSDKAGCEKLSTDFFFGECLVNAKSFYEAVSTLKNRIFTNR